MPDTHCESQQFYVYLLRDPRPNKNLQPIYIGKGKGNRAYRWWRYPSQRHHNPLLKRVLAKISKTGLNPQVAIIRRFDNEADAFQCEIALIAQYGRVNIGTGTLCNLTDGGEGCSGCLTTATARHARSRNMRKLFADPEFCAANSERMRERNADPEFARAKSERMKKLHIDPEFIKANAERGRTAMQKINSNQEHKKTAAERMRKLNATSGEQTRKRWANPEYKARLSSALSRAWIKRRAAKVAQLHINPNTEI